MKAVYGTNEDIASWMDLVERVRWNFPGLETKEGIDDYRQTLIKFVGKKQAICVKEDNKVIGILLFSRNRNMICCLAVDPNHRKQGIATDLMKMALQELDRSRDITVSTFRENDEKGTAPRALYKSFGFVEGELIEEFGYPNQVFTLYARIKPERLHKGDTIATISPSWGCAGASRVRWQYELGCEHLRELGLNVVAAPNSLKGTTYLRDNPEARAEDINWAFENKDVRAIIANIGGNDSERLFPYISNESIRNNPKILCGYSDVMSLHLFCYRQGLMTFYGDNLLTNVAEVPNWHSYSKYHFERMLFDPSEIGKIEPSKEWSLGGCKHIDKNYKKNYIPDHGYCYVQGKGKARGRLFGGHGDLLKIKDVSGETLVKKTDFDGSILFFEDIPECCDPEGMAAFFNELGEKGYLQLLNGIIIGKMRTDKPFEAYAERIRDVITGRYSLPDLPVLGDLNFGHTSPIFLLPYGAEAKINIDEMSFSLLEGGVR